MDLNNLTADERMKIKSILSDEKKSEKIDWMYSQPKDDPEAFLLGKEIKGFDQLQELTKDYEESPAQKLARFDMQAKFREDPLTLMKQREAEKRMELLKNTPKLKKLRRLLAEQKLRKEQKQKQKRWERKHPIRNRSRSSDSSSGNSRSRSTSSSKSRRHSSDSSGDELLDKFIKIIQQTDNKNDLKLELLPSSSVDIKSSHKTHKSNHDNHKHDQTNHNNRKHSHSHRSNSRSSPSQSNSYYQTQSVNKFSNQNLSNQSHYSTERNKINKLSKDELEKKRLQMMVDAQKYNQLRSDRSKKYSEHRLEEDKIELNNKLSHGPSFVKQLKNSHLSQTSIEESIHRKANSRQRGDINSNFLKR